MAYGYYGGNGNNGVSGNGNNGFSGTGTQMPVIYQNGSYGMQPAVPQMSYQAPIPVASMPGMPIFVDGEYSARAWQFPQGWPVNTPVILWDINGSIFYTKSLNSMGVPTPLQRGHFYMDETPQSALPTGQSGTSAPVNAVPAVSDYATKDDMKSMEERLMAAFNDHRGRSETGANPQQQQKGGANR